MIKYNGARYSYYMKHYEYPPAGSRVGYEYSYCPLHKTKYITLEREYADFDRPYVVIVDAEPHQIRHILTLGLWKQEVWIAWISGSEYSGLVEVSTKELAELLKPDGLTPEDLKAGAMLVIHISVLSTLRRSG